MAIAAKRPMMATTIMISTSVKPALRTVLLVFMSFSICGVNNATGGYIKYCFVHLLPVATAISFKKSSPIAKLVAG
jgi:hypothetical protein